LNSKILHIHRERCFAEIAHSTSPLDRSCRLVCCSPNPIAYLDSHGRLRKVLSIEGVGIEESADKRVVNVPFDVLRCPVDGVGMPVILVVLCRGPSRTIVRGGITSNLLSIPSRLFGIILVLPLPK